MACYLLRKAPAEEREQRRGGAFRAKKNTLRVGIMFREVNQLTTGSKTQSGQWVVAKLSVSSLEDVAENV